MRNQVCLALGLVAATALSGLTGCGSDDGAHSPSARGSIEIPLTAIGTPSGNQYRLDGSFRITANGFNRLVEGSTDQSSLFVDVPPPTVDVRLVDGWVLNGPDGMPVVDEVVLLSDNPQTGIAVTEGVNTVVTFSFGIGEEFIAPGNGQVEIVIEVDEVVGGTGGTDGGTGGTDGGTGGTDGGTGGTDGGTGGTDGGTGGTDGGTGGTDGGTGGTDGGTGGTVAVTCPCWDGTEGVSADCGGRPCESIQDVWATKAPGVCTSEDRCSDQRDVERSVLLANCQTELGGPIPGSSAFFTSVTYATSDPMGFPLECGVQELAAIAGAPPSDFSGVTITLEQTTADICFADLANFLPVLAPTEDPSFDALIPCGLPNPNSSDGGTP